MILSIPLRSRSPLNGEAIFLGVGIRRCAFRAVPWSSLKTRPDKKHDLRTGRQSCKMLYSSSVLFSATWWKAFVLAQARLGMVCLIAHIGNRWSSSYQRNLNANPSMFWTSVLFCLIAALATCTRRPGGSIEERKERKICLLSREQTEEWKGWMQWVFIFYHYYRARFVYNEIRVLVSSYVWMTGFGNFLYFDKKADFSATRVASMLVRINWFPMCLCCTLGTSMELYYVVPLHTAGFLVTYATCYLQQTLEAKVHLSYHASRIVGLLASCVIHYLFFKSGTVHMFFYWSRELEWRFTADRYSAIQGLACAMLLDPTTRLVQKIEHLDRMSEGREVSKTSARRCFLQSCLQLVGVGLMLFWYLAWGYSDEKLAYNSMHPFILIFPLLGYLFVRNSSFYMTDRYSSFLEFLGRNTLETYVLQFHVFLCRDVQHILVLLPGSHISDRNDLMSALNMLCCGCIFLTLAGEARRATVITQNCIIELVRGVEKQFSHGVVEHQQVPTEENGAEMAEFLAGKPESDRAELGTVIGKSLPGSEALECRPGQDSELCPDRVLS